MKPSKLFLGALAVALLALAGLASSLGATGRDLGVRFSSGTNKGQFVLARTHGIASDVDALYVKVTTRPKLKVAGNYVTDCDVNGSGGTMGGQFKGRSPLVVELQHRFPAPDKCQVSSTAQLNGKGRITVGMYVKHTP